MKYKRYTGEFLSHAGITWRVDIMQEAAVPFYEVGELDFPAEEPLVLDWGRTDKEEVIQSCAATLKIISPGDRTYEDLYTIEAGRIRLDIYRNGKKYWSGALDPEFYEEPYETAYGYEVSLTFSDFGILERLKYDLTGMRTLRDLMEMTLQRADLDCEIDTSLITTTSTDGVSITGGALSIRSENFVDEEGEPSDLSEVIKGILQPLAIRMIQRGGKIYLYDLNGLYTKGEPIAVQWDGDSQTMGVDKVINNVIVTFSPYGGAELLNGEIEYGGKYDLGHINWENDAPAASDYGEYYSYLPDYRPFSTGGGYVLDFNLLSFTIFLSPKGKGLKSIESGCRYFHILPGIDGASETSGVAYGFCSGGHAAASTWLPKRKLHPTIPHATTTPIMTTNRVFLPALDNASARKYRLRLVQEVLFDARYNPFSGSSEFNDEDNDYIVETCSAFVFIPASATLYDDDGNAICHYQNKDVAQSSSIGHIGHARGTWVEGPDPGGDFWLEYYNIEDPTEKAGVRGWKANRQCFGRPDGCGGRQEFRVYRSFAKLPDGEYLPYPPVAGNLEVVIMAGVNGYDYAQKDKDEPFGSTASQWDRKNVYERLRWYLYKAPKVEIVNNNYVFDSAELEDIEYSGYINKAAKEDMSLDTICGTAPSVCPTARGVYHWSETGQQVQMLKRAGRIDHPEKLLIGTLYSQYAGRKTTLTGEAIIDPGFHCYTEANQPGKRLMLMSDCQDVITDCTDAEYCEFNPDEYDSIEEIE